MKIPRHLFLLTALFLTFLSEMYSQPLQIPADNYMSNHSVNCMIEDDNGYIWIGTRRGLNRFNGSTYKHYYQKDSLSLPNDFVCSLVCDTDDRLWVGTTTGISMLRDGVVDPEVRLNCGMVSSMVMYDEDNLLVFSRSSIFLVDKTDLSMTLMYYDESQLYEKVFVTEEGMVWVIDPKSASVMILDQDFLVRKELSFKDRLITSICESRDNNIFVSTSKGLECYDAYGKKVGITKEMSERIDGSPVLFIVTNSSGRMAAGIKGKGIYLFSGQGHDIHRIWTDENLDDVLMATAILTDNNIFLSKQNILLDYRYFSSDRNVIPVSMSEVESLNMFYPMSGDKVLVITDFNAYMMEIGSDDVRKIRIDGHEPGDRLSITMFDSDSCFWMLRNDSRLCKYEFLEERMRLLAEYDIIKTSSIWRAADGGVFILQNGDVLQIRKDGTMINHRRSRYPDFWFCATTGSGLTYFLEDHGVWYFDKDNLIKRIPIEVNSPECFYMAADSTLWIGTQSEGIHVFGQDLTKKRTLTVADGLPDNTTRSIIGDESGNIWVSSRCEVYKIDPYTFDVTLYGNPENMSFRYNTNSSSITENGHVLLGSREYIATFSSREEMEFSNLQVELDGVVLNDVVLEACDKEIEVEYDNNAITFFYSAMNYDPSIRLSYRYKLEGYDDEWVNVGTSKQVQFAGLKHGHYNLIVSVRNPAGVWSDNVLECGFRVKPSPLQSPVALLSYVLISLLVLFALTRLIMKLRNNRLELEHAEHQRILNESLTKEKTDFFTNISHEYRTPLSLIYGPVTELAGSNSLNDHDKYLLSLVLQNTERMMKLTDQVLNFYSFDKERLKIMKLDVSSFLKTMLSSFEYMFMQKELTLLVEVPEGIKAYCDREKIERIFFNIISNAVKYTPEGGEITVKAGLTDDLLNISVTDTGIGIPPEKMRKIFDRFERADVENSGLNESGFGIGLNYAMHLAVLHKGYLSVSPNVPKGSVFTISLPASKSCYDPEFVILDTESSNEKAIISNETDSGVKEMTVLVAEDNVELASYIRHLLIKDYNVILAANGNEALEFIQVSAPDIIISDIMMPYKDGYSLCSEIKSSSEFCHLPVILLTAKTDSESHIKGLDLGADAFIKKPFTPELLLTTLKGLIDNRKRLQNILSGKVLSGDPVSPEDIRTMKVNSHDRIFVERLHAMMEEHLDDEDFNVMAMAKEFAMSRTSLFSKMKSLFGVSPQTWLTDYRLTKAMELLKTREFNVSEVSYKVGFSTLTGFSRSFKNKFGVPPSSI